VISAVTRRFLGLSVCLVCSFAVCVQAVSTNSAWSVQVWQSEDGLPNNNVPSVAQTPDGYIWVATPSCLARFDGVHFEEFAPATFAEAYQNLRIRLLCGGAKGGLWVAVDPGHILDIAGGRARIFTNGLPQQVVEALVDDGSGGLWVSCRGEICHVQDRGVTSFAADAELPRGSSCSLAPDGKGGVWFAKGNGVGRFRDGHFLTLLHLNRAGLRVAPARNGGVWISAGFQLFRYDDTERLQYHGRPVEETVHGDITVMAEDRSGAVWIGTSSSGLFRYNGSRFESIPTSDREILSLAEDREGNIWVGTAGGGLNRVRARPLVLESRDTGAPFDSVQSLCEDANGVIWATSQDHALERYAQGTWTTISTNSEVAAATVTCVAADGQGNVWIGTGERKLFCWRDGVTTVWDQQKGLLGRVTHALLAGRSGDLWVSSEAPDSLQRLHDGQLIEERLPAAAHHLRTMAEDNAGDLWLGGDKGVLLRVHGREVIDESAPLADLQKTIRCLHITPDGALWIGYSSGGVVRHKDGHFSRISTPQGLYVDAINQIAADGRGSMWFGSDRGIFRVREQELNDVADGRTPTLRSIHYGRSEGLPDVQARYGDWPGALRSRDGLIWMPMRTSLAVIHPEKLHEDLEPPPVLLNRIKVDDRPVAMHGGGMPLGPLIDLGKTAAVLRFPPGHRRLEFEFTALSYGPPENIHFRYRLEGFDEGWRDAGTLRSVTYSRLAAGSYTFRAQGCNSDGIWNDKGVSLAFVVEPFLWQTWWFQVGALAIFTLLVVAIVRYISFRRLRIKLQMLEQQAALDKERTRIARDIHDDLGGSLTQVALLSGLALRDWKTPELAGEHVQQISATARQVIKSLDEIVWAVNPRNDSLPELINYIAQFSVEFLRTANIRCRVKAPELPPQRSVVAEVRHNVFLTVKEALNNIVRHAQATEAWVRITAEGDSVVIAIEDNGRGFDQAPENGGADGLRNMRQRMEEIGGKFGVESIPRTGTRISLTYPLIAAQKNGNQH
jgi:signal transduction histidine kinase/ligand-binding sensor domain-containing protein